MGRWCLHWMGRASGDGVDACRPSVSHRGERVKWLGRNAEFRDDRYLPVGLGAPRQGEHRGFAPGKCKK